MPDAMPQAESVQKLAMRFGKYWATAGRHMENIKENAMQVARLQRHYSCLSAAGFLTPMKTLHDTAAPSRGRTELKKAVAAPKLTNGALASHPGVQVATNGNGHANGEDFDTLEIRELKPANCKPRFEINSKAVINDGSAFGHKKLCDGLTFTAGHACAFSCTYCYVPGMLFQNKRLNAIKRERKLKPEDFIVEIADAPAKVREYLTVGGDTAKPKYKDPGDQRVIFASPLVDVAGNLSQVEVTVAMCLEILKLTHWHIRLLSKSALLRKVAEQIPAEFKQRVIYGLSTGTVDNGIASAIEKGAPSVAKRLETLHWLQENGYRTYGMICPILPQKDEAAYREFAEQAAAQINLGKCEHVWAEVLNARGDSLDSTTLALRQAGRHDEADLLDKVANDKEAWQEYAMRAFLALSKVIPAEKLRFLQYTTKKEDFERWEECQSAGAVLLGVKLGDDEKGGLAVSEAAIEANLNQFAEVVLNLKKIKDNKWYREYGNFENYCRVKFDFGRAHSYRMLQAAKVVVELNKPQTGDIKSSEKSPIGDFWKPRNEAQAREVGRIKPEKRLEVIQKALKQAGDAPLTAGLIRQVATSLKPVRTKPVLADFDTPKSYTTDLNVFLDWVASLKSLAQGGSQAELVKLLEKAERDKAIIPELDVLTFTAEDVQNGWLSNLSEHDVEYNGQIFTVEGLFHWLRFEGHPEIQAQLAKEANPEDALRVAMNSRHLLSKPDEGKAVAQMRECLRLKIEQHPNLVKKLLATGSKVLVMDCTANPKGDDFFWGMAKRDDQWVGKNWLGRLWWEIREKKPRVEELTPEPESKSARLRLYGKNRSTAGSEGKSYWTPMRYWFEQRRQRTKRRPFAVNVTSNAAKTELNFTSLSPMLMGPEIECYQENGRGIKAVSVEVAWQYSKVYSHVLDEKTGLLEDLKGRYVTQKGGKDYPAAEWFKWRDAAYRNWAFDPSNPDMDKDGVRRGFPKGSTVAFWYWAGEVIHDRAEARKRIYATLYQKHLLKTPAYHKLREIFNGSADAPSRDLMIFDYDGYDWLGLEMTPEECLLDDHSFGHGLVISLNLLGIDPTKIEVRREPERFEFNVNWRDHYDNYDWQGGRQAPLIARRKKGIEEKAAAMLEIHEADVKRGWGVAYPPGCFAQTVIAVNDGVRHRHSKYGKIGLKIFNLQRGLNEWGRLKKFYREYRAKLPGMEVNQHIQKVYEWGICKNADGVERPCLAQEWIEGETIEQLIKAGKISRADVLRILDDLFLKLLIPLWGQGTKWWDARQSNYVLHPQRGLVMIDPDTLADFAEEIATTPGVYEKRNKFNPDEAISRYTTMIIDLALACSDGKPDRSLKKAVRSLCAAHLDSCFRVAKCPYPLPADWSKKATAAYQAFRVEYEQLLNSAGQPLKTASRQSAKKQRNQNAK